MGESQALTCTSVTGGLVKLQILIPQGWGGAQDRSPGVAACNSLRGPRAELARRPQALQSWTLCTCQGHHGHVQPGTACEKRDHQRPYLLSTRRGQRGPWSPRARRPRLASSLAGDLATNSTLRASSSSEVTGPTKMACFMGPMRTEGGE